MIDKIKNISIEAGNAIMEIYNSTDFGIELKTDNSPLTLADKSSHEVIVKRLKEEFPEIPILSEEGKDIPYDKRKEWQKFWLVDPLDGTKEFIKKNGEFTVNIALIENNKPVLGVIYAPALRENNNSNIKENSFPGVLYYGDKKNGAYKSTANGEFEKIHVRSDDNKVIAVKSRSHSSEDENKILEKYGVTDSISVGSSLKFCMVAEGKAQIYYRHGPTNEWDVGAGHAIVEAAGGKVEGLYYNKEKILNSSFLVKAI